MLFLFSSDLYKSEESINNMVRDIVFNHSIDLNIYK